VKQARQGAIAGQSAAAEQALNLPPGALKYVKHPARFIGRMLQGQGPAFRKMAFLRQASKDLGYQQAQDTMTGYMGQQYDPTTGQPIVNYHPEVTPQGTAWQQTVGKHIDPVTGQVTGLTPAEKETVFNEQATPLKARALQAEQDEASREAAAGIDPRSGVAAGRMAGLTAQEEAGLAEAGRQTTLADIQRQMDWENQAAGVMGTQERAREQNINADVTRAGQIQTGLTDLAALSENQRQFDVTYTEGQRQAAQAREDARKAAAAAKPSGLEITGGIIGGLAGGLTGKG